MNSRDARTIYDFMRAHPKTSWSEVRRRFCIDPRLEACYDEFRGKVVVCICRANTDERGYVDEHDFYNEIVDRDDWKRWWGRWVFVGRCGLFDGNHRVLDDTDMVYRTEYDPKKIYEYVVRHPEVLTADWLKRSFQK